MNNLEKVIKGLVSCNSVSCQKCPYNEKKECNDRGFFYSQAIEDAIQMLKEREPKPVKITRNAYDYKFYNCPNCDHDFYDFYQKPNFCEKCGQAVKWDA